MAKGKSGKNLKKSFTAAYGRELTLQDIPLPMDTVEDNFINAAWILSKMDVAGGRRTFDYIRDRAVTVGIQGMSFTKPIFVGDLVSIYTRIARQGTSSLTVKVESWAKRRENNVKEKVTEGYFTFVAIDKNHKPTEIKTRRPASLNRKIHDSAHRANMEEAGSAPLRRIDPVLRVIPEPKDTNYLGDIFGGWILAHMDRACAKAAENFTGKRAATVGLESMTFNKPVFVGDEVSFHAEVCGTGDTSVSVRVETWARRRMTGVEEKVTEGVFTYVCFDKHNKPVSVRSSDKRRMRPC